MVFQPHRHTRTNDLFSEFVDVLTKIDNLILLDIYSAGESHINGVSSEELMNKTRHFYETTLDYFGANRCMFESNFPVDKLSCSYVNLWNSFKKLTKNYSNNERTLLFHDTASKAYKLK